MTTWTLLSAVQEKQLNLITNSLTYVQTFSAFMNTPYATNNIKYD